MGSLPAQDLILDGEAIAFDAPAGRYPFQVTMRRFGRKLDVERLRAELPMRAFFFDCLRFDGREPRRPARRGSGFASLRDAVPDSSCGSSAGDRRRRTRRGRSTMPRSRPGTKALMAKSLEAPYEAGNRGASWLKIKHAHTLDLVVLAAEWGHGRRTGKLSNLHLGALDPETGDYVMLGKTFKGLTDAMLDWQTKEFLARETHRDEVTVYVRPELVVEIAFSDLQASSRYPGGLALRLARVKRYRDDKSAEQADTMATVRRIHEASTGALPSSQSSARAGGKRRAYQIERKPERDDPEPRECPAGRRQQRVDHQLARRSEVERRNDGVAPHPVRALGIRELAAQDVDRRHGQAVEQQQDEDDEVRDHVERAGNHIGDRAGAQQQCRAGRHAGSRRNLASVRGRKPSRAIAYGTRDMMRVPEWSAPNEQSMSPMVRSEAPAAPIRRTRSSPATDDVSGMLAIVSGLST